MAAQYIPLGASTYDVTQYDVPSIKLENWFAEEAGDRNDRPYRLLPTPGLTSFASGLNGAIRGINQFDGLLDDKAVLAAGLRVYSMTSTGTTAEIGTITGMDGVSFAASQSDVVMTAGNKAFVVTASLSSAISFPGIIGDKIVDVAEINQRHLFVEGGSGRMWFSEVVDPTNVPATNFVTAENKSDPLIAVKVSNGIVYLFGSQTTQLFENTGSAAIPFRSLNVTANIGIVARDAVAEADGSLFAVGRSEGGNKAVYQVLGAQVSKVSTPPIERLIGEVTEANRGGIRLSAHGWEGHTFVGLHLPLVGDYFFDTGNQTWHRRKEIADDRYLASTFLAAFGEKFAGDSTTGTIYRLDLDVFTHNTATVRRVATTVIPIEDNRPEIKNLTVEMQGGVGLVSGQGENPKVMMRYAPNGRKLLNERTASFGKIGDFGHRAIFRGLGRMTPPQVLVEIAVTDPVNATVTGLVINRDVA